MSVQVKDLDITAAPTLCVQTLKVVSLVNARVVGPVMESVAQVHFVMIVLFIKSTNIENPRTHIT